MNSPQKTVTQASGTVENSSLTAPVPRKSRQKTPPTASSLGQGVSAEAGLRAAAILEVLAGERTAQQAAAALSVSLPYFYLLERQALSGLVRACEPRPKGPPPPDTAKQLAALEQELQRCRRECQRQAALVPATQRAVGLPTTPPPPVPPKKASSQQPKAAQAAGGSGAKRRRRRPTTRALQAARTVRQNSAGSPKPAELQPSVTENGSSVSHHVFPGGTGDVS